MCLHGFLALENGRAIWWPNFFVLGSSSLMFRWSDHLTLLPGQRQRFPLWLLQRRKKKIRGGMSYQKQTRQVFVSTCTGSHVTTRALFNPVAKHETLSSGGDKVFRGKRCVFPWTCENTRWCRFIGSSCFIQWQVQRGIHHTKATLMDLGQISQWTCQPFGVVGCLTW